MSFADIYGQKRAINLLQADFKQGRVGHAYLFYGPAGVGKCKTAAVFAKLLNCEQPKNLEPCGFCTACRKFSTGNFPDLAIVEPVGQSLKIEQIRALQEKIYLKSYEGKYKVIIIKEADLMTNQAANSLLKILEEPPQKTVFILLVSDLSKLPVTICSRCQLLAFTYLSDEILSKLLQEKGERSAAVLLLAQGSVTKARQIMQADFRDKIEKRFEVLQKKGYWEWLLWAEELAEDENLSEFMLEWLLIVYHQRLLELTVEERELGKISQAVVKGCFKALEEINQTIFYLRNKGNRRLAWEVLFLKLSKIEQSEGGVALYG